MPHNKSIFPYAVLGNGEIANKALIDILRVTGKVKQPIPEIIYARDMESAKEIAKKLAYVHETVLICKIERVVK